MNINRTLSWYNKNAFEYVASTKDSLVHDALREFLQRVKKDGLILDFGCGSGRDSRYFLDLGYSVVSTDGSPFMAREAKRVFDIDVRVSSFLSLKEEEAYDGVWAQASILHLREDELKEVLVLIERALKDGGIFYSSFRKGIKDGEEGERYYTNMTLERYKSLLPSGLVLVKAWEGRDVRKGVDKTWISFIAEKNL